MVIRFALGLALSILCATALAPIAVAECSLYNRPVDTTLNVGFAFTATVVDASSAADPQPRDVSPYDWHVELRVDRTYVGNVPKRLLFNGWNGNSCSTIRGNRLTTGDRIVVAVEDIRLRRLPTQPMGGDTVVWRWENNSWRYAGNVVGNEDYPIDEFLSPTIRQAATTADIVRIVRWADPPDTATLEGTDTRREGSGRPPWTVLATAGLLGLLASLRLLSRRPA